MTGYIRVDTSNNISDGNIINADDLDSEFDGVQTAFNASTGHTHGGASGEGAPITAIGPTQDVTASSTLLAPKTTNTIDIGSASLKFKDLYVAGTSYLSTLDLTTIEVSNIKAKDGTAAGTIADSTGVVTLASSVLTTADINGGNADNVVIGGTTAAAGTFTTATATTGNITTVNATTVNATTVDTTNIEVTTLKAKDGTAAGSIADSTGVVTLASSVLTTADINGGTADNVIIGGSTAAAANFTTVGASGVITSTVSTGTAPLTIASTTKVSNLNVDQLDGADWASPAAIGSTAPASGAFTTLSASGTLSVTGVATLTAQPIVSSLTASKAVFSDSSKGLVSNDITGTGNVVMSTSPTLVTPTLGTPASVTLTNATGLPVSTGISGLGTGVATALAVNVGSAGAPVVFDGALGTPSSGTVTNLTGTASININGTVGATTASSGAFTTLSASGQLTSTVSTGTAPLVIASTTKVSNLNADLLDGGDWASPSAIGTTAAAAGTFTTLTATSDSAFTSTGAVQLSKGTTAERPTGASGKLRFNTTTAEFEGHNGTAWASVGGASISNDTSTSTNIYPLMASATTGTASTVYTSNAKLLYKPSTGELQSSILNATNGIVVNSQTVAVSYTIPTGSSAMSSGPITVASGQSVTIASGSRWVIL